MAEAKKTGKPSNTTVKTATKKEVAAVELDLEVIEEVKEVVEQKVEQKVESKKETTLTKKIYDPSETISCKSVTDGTLMMIGKKTGILYKWVNFGDYTDIEYQDIHAAIISKSRFIFDPLFIIEDEEFVSQRKEICELYEKMYKPEDLEALFALNTDTFARTLKQLPIGIKNSVKTLAATKIQDGTLDSISKIKAIDEILGTELLLYVD